MQVCGFDIKVGADPEFFVQKNGKPVSAYGLIGGTKDKPLKVNKGGVQVDGMALEFNIDPAYNYDEFNDNLDEVMRIIKGMVPGYEMYPGPVAHFGQAYIDKQPDEAKILGCEPDFNAYTGEANPAPNVKTPFRSAAGHLHIGWCDGVDATDAGHMKACMMLSRSLDKHLGLMSVLWDTDQERRQLYGKAGCYRAKPYGMEYRTLSNAWLSKKPILRRFLYGNIMEAFKDCMDHPDQFENDPHNIEEIINTGNAELALETIGNLGIKTVSDYEVKDV